MLLSKCFDLFILDKKVYCSDQSVNYYCFYLKRFLSYLDITDIEQLTKHYLKDYILSLRGSMKNTSLATNYRAVKVFCRWCFDEGYLDLDITKGVKLPKQDPTAVEPLTIDEVQAIDNVIFNQKLSLRNYCMFHLMLDCGLRRQEVINLKHGDYKHDRIIIHNSKGNKDRIVLLPEFLYLSLRNYYNESHYIYPGSFASDYVFLDDHNSERISIDTIKMFFQKLKKSSGVSRVHAHLCRHTFATSYLQYGGDMEKLRLLMGHSDYNVLRNYLHLSLVYTDIYKLDDIFFRR